MVPRGSALGYVMQLPEKDELSWSKKQLLAKMDVCMGGRVAEEMIFGEDSITTGIILHMSILIGRFSIVSIRPIHRKHCEKTVLTVIYLLSRFFVDKKAFISN